MYTEKKNSQKNCSFPTKTYNLPLSFSPNFPFFRYLWFFCCLFYYFHLFTTTKTKQTPCHKHSYNLETDQVSHMPYQPLDALELENIDMFASSYNWESARERAATTKLTNTDSNTPHSLSLVHASANGVEWKEEPSLLWLFSFARFFFFLCWMRLCYVLKVFFFSFQDDISTKFRYLRMSVHACVMTK